MPAVTARQAAVSALVKVNTQALIQTLYSMRRSKKAGFRRRTVLLQADCFMVPWNAD